MSMTLSPASFLENLRNATSQSHAGLEALPISASIMNPNVSKAEYTLYLTLMNDIVRDAETNIFQSLSFLVPDIEERKKSHLLKSDLEDLGHLNLTEKRPISSGITNYSAAFALGIMYVVEGSSLGGRVILKNISNALQYDGENGARYFAGYGSQTGSYWKRFLDILQQYEAENSCGTEIIEGADYAFKAISQHFKNNTIQ